MLNLIKMDMYRMFHSLSTWVILAVTVGLAAFSVIATNLYLEAMNETVSQETVTSIDGEESSGSAETEDNTVVIGIQVDTNPEWIQGKINMGDLVTTQLRSGLLVLLCVIITAIFTCADQKNGYIKNIAGQLPNRGVLAVSKMICLAILTVIMMAVFILTVIITGAMFWSGRLYMEDWGSLLTVLGTQYLLHMGFCALVMFLCTLTKSSAVGMTVGIVIMIGLLMPVYSVINYGIAQINSHWNFDISKYMLEGNLSLARTGAPAGDLIHGSAVGAVFILLGTIFAMVIMKKRDVR